MLTDFFHCIDLAEYEAESGTENDIRRAQEALTMPREHFPAKWRMECLDDAIFDPTDAYWDTLRNEITWANNSLLNRAIDREERRLKQTGQASRKGQRSKWDVVRLRVEPDAIKIWQGDRTLNDKRTAEELLARWSREGIDPLPPQKTVERWIAGIDWPAPKKTAH